MGRIGPYEILSERAPGLHVARGPRKGTCLVRLSTVPGTDQDEAAVSARAMGPAQVLGRAQAQARAGKSKYWVPILDSGTLAGQAYCVYPHYPDSIQRYLGFTSVSELALWSVLDRLLHGLQEYRVEANRPHGNLTPANILLGQTRGAWWQTVLLSDPLGDGDVDPASGSREDLRNLGVLLFHLVLQRPPDLHEVPAADAPWEAAIGTSGPAWRVLCADLLDRSRSLDLDEVMARVAGLRPRVRAGHRVRSLLIAACPLVLVLAAGLVAVADYQVLPPAARGLVIRLRCLAGIASHDPDAWGHLCDEYHGWLDGFAVRAARPQAAGTWRQYPYLERLLGMLEEAKGAFDPVQIGGEAMAYSDLRSSVPERARECGSYELVLGAQAHADAIRSYLNRAATDLGGWDALRYVTGPLAERCEAGRWTATAEHLRGLRGALAPPASASTADARGGYAGGDAIDAAIEWWTAVGATSQDLDDRTARLSASGDPFLARFGAAVAGELAKGAARSQGTREDIDQLRGYLDEAAKLAGMIETLLGKEWTALSRDRQDLWRAEADRRVASGTPLDFDTCRAWMSDLRQFSTDPSLDWVLEARGLAAITGSAVLNREWQRRRDELIGPATEPVRPEVRRNEALRGQVRTWRDFLSSLDDQSILPLPSPGPAGAAVQVKRETALAQILALGTGTGTDASALKASGGVQDLCGVYRRWRRDLPLLVEALAGARVLLMDLYAYAEAPTPAEPPPLRSTREAWSGKDVWNAEGLPEDLAAACRWLDALADIDARQPRQTPADRAWLQEQARTAAAQLPVAVAAWRRLGEADWPRGDAEQQAEEAVRRELSQGLSSWVGLDAGRRARLEWELKTEGERRSVRDVLEKLEADPDPALKRFVRFYQDTLNDAQKAAGDPGRMSELASTSSLARGLARVVMKPDWPVEYDRASLAQGLPPPETFSEAFYQGWPDRAEGFRLLRPDPRGEPAAWEGTLARLRTVRAGLEGFPAERDLAAGQLDQMTALRDGLLATPPIRANQDAIRDLRQRLESAVTAFEAGFAPVTDPRLLPAEQWDRRLAQLSGDIEDLTGDRPELRALHGELAAGVKQLLTIAPVARNRETIAASLAAIAKLERSIEEGTDPRVWLERVAARQSVSAVALANDVWQGLRDEALRGVTVERLRAERGLYRSLRDRLETVAGFLGQRPWEEVLPSALPSAPAGLPELAWHADIAPALARHRHDSLQTAARRCAESAEEADKELAAYGEVRRVLVLARDQLTLADLRLSQWALPREALDGATGPAIGECLRAWSEARPELSAWRRELPQLDAFCTGLFALAAGLEQVLAAPTADALVAALPGLLQRDEEESRVAVEPGAGLSRRYAACLQVYAAYLRLGETGWPRTLQEMTDDLAYSDRLLARAPADRRETLARALGAARRERWATGFERLTDCGQILHGSIALLPRLEVDCRRAVETYTHVGLRAQVNLRVAWLVAQLGPETRPDDALAARDEAARMLTALGTQVKYPDPMFTYIEDRVRSLTSLSGREADAAVRGLARCGPGRAGWQLAPGSEGNPTYTTTLGRTSYALAFVRVAADPGDASRAAFVCTTELPVGLFAAACAHLKDRGGRPLGEPMLLFLAEELRTPALDPRRGPRTWQVGPPGEQQDGPVVIPRLWLNETPFFVEGAHYPPGGTPPAPTPDQPLQYIPPRAAVFLSLALGCRLPTAYEWQQAAQAAPGDARPANLRDELWRQQFEHIRQLPVARQGIGALLGAKVPKHWPNADAFPVGNLPEELDAECLGGNDACLWFREVPGGGRTAVGSFADLAGNVREFVFEGSRLLDQLLERGAPTRDDLRSELTNPRKFAVMGDSALSRPAPDQRAVPQPIPAGISGWDRGFSDVGVRLAFTAPDEDLPEKLRALAEGLCLTPSGK